MKYKAVFLDDAEFESLPFRDMGDKVGVADPKTGTAYARKSGIPVIDAFNIMHELEHLEEGHEGVHADHFDPEHGVYYKGFGNMFSSMGQGLSNMGGAFSRGLGSMGQGIQGLFGGGQNPVGATAQAGKNFPQLSQSQQPGGYFSQPFAQAGGPSIPNLSVIPKGSIPGPVPGTSGINPKNPMTMFAGSRLNMPSFNFGGGGGMGGGGGQPTPPQVALQPQTQAPALKENPLQSMFGQNTNLAQLGAGTAIGAFGQMASPKVKMPNLMELPSVQALQSKQFGNFQELDPELQAAINRDFDMIDSRERDRLIATYKSLRPGADIESDSSFARDMAELQDSQGKRRVDQLAKYRFEYLSKQLQMSELELRQMTELAQLDIATIMAQLGIDAQAAQDFKQTFSSVGQAFVSSGLGINQPQEEPAQ